MHAASRVPGTSWKVPADISDSVLDAKRLEHLLCTHLALYLILISIAVRGWLTLGATGKPFRSSVLRCQQSGRRTKEVVGTFKALRRLPWKSGAW